jgi:hypothetical protein
MQTLTRLAWLSVPKMVINRSIQTASAPIDGDWETRSEGVCIDHTVFTREKQRNVLKHHADKKKVVHVELARVFDTKQ